MARLLFENIDQVRVYVDISASFKWEKIKPFLRRANDKYIVPALSEDEINEFPPDLSTLPTLEQVEAKDPADWTDDDKRALLLDKIRAALANFGYYLFMPHLITNTDNTGIHITSKDNEKSAFEWMVEKERTSYVNMAYESLESMLKFLEEHKDVFTDWAGSDAYTELNAHFINTAESFNDYAHIDSRRFLFMKIKPALMMVEENQIISVIGQETYDVLKEYIKTKTAVAAGGMDGNEVADWHGKLLWYIRRALANLTMAESVVRLASAIGLEWIGEWQRMGQRMRTAAKDERLEALQEMYAQKGKNYLDQMNTFFEENRDKYPPYTAPEETEAVEVNDEDSGIVLM